MAGINDTSMRRKDIETAARQLAEYAEQFPAKPEEDEESKPVIMVGGKELSGVDYRVALLNMRRTIVTKRLKPTKEGLDFISLGPWA